MPMKSLCSIIYEKQIYFSFSSPCHITARKVETQYNVYSLIPYNVHGQSIKIQTCMLCPFKGCKLILRIIIQRRNYSLCHHWLLILNVMKNNNVSIFALLILSNHPEKIKMFVYFLLWGNAGKDLILGILYENTSHVCEYMNFWYGVTKQ